MTDANDLWILGGARTPMAEYSGTPGFGKLQSVSAIDLGAASLTAALERTGIAPDQVDHVVMGNALQTSADALYGARHVLLKAGLPIDRPALTVNRLCGSGIESIISGARMIRVGEARVVAAGGMESMSQAPHVLRGGRNGFRFGAGIELEDLLFSALKDPVCGLYMAQTAQNLANQYGISREDQDVFALRSHQLGAEAVATGRFAEEIVAVEVKSRKATVVVDTDDHIKPDTTLEALSRLPAAFGKDGTVTAGNASGIVDGAATVLVASEARARELGHSTPLGRIVGWAAVGVDPAAMGIGPAPAIRKVCEQTGVGLDQIDLFEINEAFSAQYLAVEKELGLNRDRVNVNGGAIALGHPLGATGTRLVLTLLMSLKRSGGRFGVASACIGGGQGIALLVESLCHPGHHWESRVRRWSRRSLPRTLTGRLRGPVTR